jgi:putative redox protein
MDVISILRKKHQDVRSFSVETQGHQMDAHPNAFTRIDVTYVVTGVGVDPAAVARAIELSATKYCPVNAMLSAGATEIHHRYVVHDTGPSPSDAEGEVVVTGPFRRPDVIP